MWIEPVNPQELLNAVKPVLASTADEVAARVRGRWTGEQLCQLLSDPSGEVRKVACLVVGLIGERCCAPALAALLRDDERLVVELAEHALWSIWFRAGNRAAQVEFQRGLAAMESNAIEGAVSRFRAARRHDPGFAEAYNQSAIALYLTEQWEEAAADCRRTIALMPMHFGALAGLGHCHAQMGDLELAARSYRRALAIHPGLDEIAAMLERIEVRRGAA